MRCSSLTTEEVLILLKCYNLIQNHKNAKDKVILETFLKHYARYQLLIIDEIGYLPLQPINANLLFQIIDRWYKKKSPVVTSINNCDEWTTIIYNDQIANAIINRLLHHAHVISITRGTYQLQNTPRKKE